MSSSPNSQLDILSEVRRRIRSYALASEFIRLLVVLGLVVSALSALTVLRWRGAAWVFWILIAFGVGVLGLALFRLLRRARDTDLPFRILENRYPNLRSDPTTVFEWNESGRANRFEYSEALFAALEEQVRQNVAATSWKSDFGPAAFFRTHRRGVIGLGALLVLSIFTIQPRELIRLAKEPLRPGDLRAVVNPVAGLKVGDVKISLRFPKYTGLPERNTETVQGFRVDALRGTEATLRFDVDPALKSAGILLPGGEFRPARMLSDHSCEVDFTLRVTGPAKFQGVDQKGGEREAPESLDLNASADLPPKVEWKGMDSEIQAELSQNLNFTFDAEDDFGLTEKRLEFSAPGFHREVSLGKSAQRSESVSRAIPLGQLGLPRNTKVVEVLGVAIDNDETSGRKEGKSKPLRLIFRTAEESRQAKLLKYGEWLEALIKWLGDDLENFGKPPERLDSAWVQSWKQSPIGARSLLNSKTPEKASRENMELVRRLELLLSRRGTLEKVLDVETGWESFVQKYPDASSAEISGLEDLILLLVRAMETEKFQGLKDRTEDMADLAKRLSQELERPDHWNASTLKDSLNQVAEALKQLQAALSELAKPGTGEFANREAFAKQDLGQFRSQMAEIERLIQAGKIEEARKKLKELVDRLKSVNQDLRKETDQVASAADQKLRKDLKKLGEDLHQLTEDQQKLLDETKNAKAKNPEGKEDPKLAAANEKLRKKIAELQAGLDRAASEVPADKRENWKAEALRALQSAKRSAKELRASHEVRDVDSMRKEAKSILEDLDALLKKGRALRGFFERSVPEGLGGGALKGFQSADASHQKAEEIMEMIKPGGECSGGGSSEGQEQSQKLAEKQESLQKRLRGLRKQFGEMSKRAPISDVTEHEGFKRSDDAMGSAEGKLKENAREQATGHQRDAIAGLESVEQAFENAEREMQRPSESPGGGMESVSQEPVLLPEDTPSKEREAWKKSIMDAMKKKPPEGYEDLTRKYFEELAR